MFCGLVCGVINMVYYTTQVFGRTIIYYKKDNIVVSFGEYPDNTDYQAYLRWLEEGNTPLPAEENQ